MRRESVPGHRLSVRTTRRARDEGGFVLAWMALLLTTLIGFAGLGLDTSNLWLTADRVQKAADAAALAGVVYLPGNTTEAEETARDLAGRNGYETGVEVFNAFDDDSPEFLRPNQILVRITTTVPMYFAGLLGVESSTVIRHSVAEFSEPVKMGSPENYLGNDPERNPSPPPDLWINVAGPQANKGAGDRFASNTCSGTTFLCSGTNQEYSEDGYFFSTKLADNAPSGTLNFSVWDAPFAMVGDLCSVNLLSSTQRNELIAQWSYYSDANTRYASGSANKFCTGDNLVGANGIPGMVTTFVVRGPDDTPWDPADNPVICSRQFPAYESDFYDRLLPYDRDSNGNFVPNSLFDNAFATSFRRAVVLGDLNSACRVTAPVKDKEYFVQVLTNVPQAPNLQPFAAGTTELSYTPDLTRRGHNRFSLRAGIGQTLVSTGVSLYAQERLPIYANAGTSGATPIFYLARIDPSPESGRLLNLEFWDIGDVSGGTTNMTILPPQDGVDGNGQPIAFTECNFRRAGTPVGNGTCSLTNMTTADYNGRLVTAEIEIPADYNCSVNQVTGCWVRVRMSYSSGAQPLDTTTWSASITGDPVRLLR